MNWDKWYSDSDSPAASTIYWYATGKRVGLVQITARALKRHSGALLDNLIRHNQFLEKLRKSDTLYI